MADQENYKREEEEEEDEEVDEIDYRSQKYAVLFVIDISDSMLTSPPSDSKKADTDSPTLAALKCAYMIMQQRIISSPKDMMGIMLYGTEETKFKDQAGLDTSVYPHCYLLTDLNVPSAEDVKALKEIVEEEEDIVYRDPLAEDTTHILLQTKKIFPAGLWLYPMPYADDLRGVSAPAPLTAPDKLIDKMRMIVQQLQLPKAQYDARKLPKPKFYNGITKSSQAIALERRTP
ncbi:hypothetical protein DID88_002637 [Monilinia fructigena]|uniref:Ku70/Ku80 N-terminal alpha/beta domain-containing protein n=1 Tax=Monilinia fructigena TaxID=38457 RepID=A0A395IRY3_9HELO|nr:hypothetical protein DID88_002637 [Monilinia fructigena]